MTIWINADLFDHGIPYSSVKWSPGMVSSLLEELRAICPNKTLTQSKWLDLVASRMTVAEAQSYWSTFLGIRTSLSGQCGDWIDLQTLGILLLCQSYPHIKARADSFNRNEALVQTLANTVAVSQSPLASPLSKPSLIRNSAGMTSIKPVRDNACISQFVSDHILLFCAFSSFNLTTDEDFDIGAEAIEKLGILFFCEGARTLCDELLPNGGVIKSCNIVPLLSAKLSWNDILFPAFDVNGPAEHTVLTSPDVLRKCLLICNQTKTTILEPAMKSDRHPVSVHIVNCSDTTIYLSEKVQFVSLVGCTDCELVALAVTGGIVVNNCDKLIVRAVTASLRFENATDCSAFAYTTRAIILTADTRGITLAPFNVLHSKHHDLLNAKTGLYPDASHSTTWALPICCTLTDSSSYVILSPDKIRLVNFPEFHLLGGSIKLAVCWPDVYATALSEKLAQYEQIKDEIAAIADPGSIHKVNSVIAGHFREWVTANNKTKTMVDIIKQHGSNQ